ncbi:MAG: glycosyltransferase family 2 protein [Bacilli bacterium]|nr:glycosyltransferase family 2 protein [Bacilli bacterium]
MALDSLIPGGEDIEVLIIDDGSKDGTLKVAKEYEERYPNIFRAIHQENKGHGGAINNALSQAQGTFFKVLDSDDKVDEESLRRAIAFLKEKGSEIDLLVMDYVYYHGWDNPTNHIGFRTVMKQGTVLTPNEVKQFTLKQNITLHTAMYKTSVLRESKVNLPEHCSYEDNYMVYALMFYIKHLAYLALPFYCYFIGREGQSMQEDILKRKYFDFIRCAELIWDAGDVTSFKKTNKGLYRLLRHHLHMNMAYAYTFAHLNDSPEALQDLRDFDEKAKKKNLAQWKNVHRSIQFRFMGTTSKFGHWRAKTVYKLAHLFVRFN